MDSNITIHIVEPGSSTPVVPDTGLFTSGIGGPEATILGITAAVIILAVVVAVLYYRNKKQGKFISLKHKKATTIGLASLAAVVSLGTLAGLLKLGANAIDAEADEAEEVAEVTDGELTIELGDEPVFAWIKSTVTVDEEMPAGYVLKAYSENPTLSSEGTDKTISLVTIPEDGLENAGSLTTSLTDNTWGLAVEEPESEEQEIYFSLPATAEEAVTIATVEDMEAEGSDTVTVYYGVYVTPDMPYGTYTGASVNYILEDNSLATVIFDGNGLYFDGNESETTNVVKYNADGVTEYTNRYSHTSNLNDAGEVIDPSNSKYPVNEKRTYVYEFEGANTIHVDLVRTGSDSCSVSETENSDMFLSFWSGSHPDYTAEANYGSGIRAWGNTTGKYIFGLYARNESLSADVPGDTLTLAYTTANGGTQRGCSSGYGYYAILTGYDADGNPVYLNGNKVKTGQYILPESEKSYSFLGWSENEKATTPTYVTEEGLALKLSLNPSESITLYAIWQPTFSISYNGNGADTTTNMNDIEQYTTDLEPTNKQVDLLASNFTREGYGFAGWSTDADAWSHLTDSDTSNDPTIYGPNQTITIDENAIAEAGENRKLVLNAVWVPAEQNNGSPVTLQNWAGCSSLTATTYNSETGELTVGKNTITALTDARDGSVYTVARLADGNCWTVENLKLDDKSELSANNTNNPSLPLTNNYEEETTSNYLSATSDDWCTDWDSAPCYNQSKLNTDNTVLTATSPVFSQDFTNEAHNWSTGSLNANITSYGNYYNWYSATAGQGIYSTGWDEEQETNIYEDTLGDICPTGWHLPYGGSGEGGEGESKGNTNGGFYYLNNQMGGDTSSQGSNNWRSFPNNFVYSGDWSGSSAYNRGSYGYYWSSTADGTRYAYNLNLDSGYVTPGNYGVKYNGNSVRCLAPSE